MSKLLACLLLLAQPVEVLLSPSQVIPGKDSYTITVPGLAGKEIELRYRLNGGPWKEALRFCRLDAQGKAVIPVESSTPQGIVEVIGVRPTGQAKWLPTNARIEILPPDWGGGKIVLPTELELKRSPKPLLSPSPGSWDGREVAYPRLVEREGRMFLFYSGFDGVVWRTGLALSRDGVSWQKNPRPILEPSSSGWDSEYMAARGSVLVEKGSFLYWYQGGRARHGGIGLASSVDGLDWTKQPAPVLVPGPPGSWDSGGVGDPYVVRCGEILYLYYVGQDSGDTSRLGMASSRDGIHWAKYPRNPVLGLGDRGAFDERGLEGPAALAVSRGLALFYTGRDAQGSRRIGLSLSADGVTWRKVGVVLDRARSPYVSVSGKQLLLWDGGLHIGVATGRVEQGVLLFFEHATLEPSTKRSDTPTGRWAFPYQGNTLVTLPGSSLTFVVEVPERGRLRAALRMPLAGAEPARAVVRSDQQELFSLLLEGNQEVDLNVDLSAFAGQKIQLQLAALPGPRGQRAAWIGWRNPRVVAEAER